MSVWSPALLTSQFPWASFIVLWSSRFLASKRPQLILASFLLNLNAEMPVGAGNQRQFALRCPTGSNWSCALRNVPTVYWVIYLWYPSLLEATFFISCMRRHFNIALFCGFVLVKSSWRLTIGKKIFVTLKPLLMIRNLPLFVDSLLIWLKRHCLHVFTPFANYLNILWTWNSFSAVSALRMSLIFRSMDD